MDPNPVPVPSDNLDHAKLVSVFSSQDEPSAALRVHVLADAGIRAVVVGALTAGMRTESLGWVQVKVLEHDEAEARRVLSEVRREEPAPDAWNTDEPVDGA